MKNGTKTVLACAVIFTVSFTLTGLVMGTGEGAAEPAVQTVYAEAAETVQTAETAEVADIVTPSSEGYVLRSYEGNVAVFYGEFQAVPAIETNISVEDLRSADRELLESGIRVSSYEDVVRLLEDFNS
ncbi:MAG: BofC C-terminal domain-containing protein [Oscillospiraceae bacterium]